MEEAASVCLVTLHAAPLQPSHAGQALVLKANKTWSLYVTSSRA